ncbi:IS1634 family transposase, partial [Leucobacter sp. HY1910]
MSRHIQEATGISIKRFVKLLAPVKDAVIVIEGNEHRVPAALTGEVAGMLSDLGELSGGH